MTDSNQRKTLTPYTPPPVLLKFLNGGLGRAAYFSKVDPGLFPAIISKMKAGVLPISFEFAIRMERAQQPSDTPFTADQIMTFEEHQALYRYVTGQEPRPSAIDPTQRPPRVRKELTQAGA